MPEIRIAALDLDGTLLSRENTVTPATRQAIADAAARGVVVLPATGRALANLPPLVAQLPGVRYAITSNGAAVWDLGPDPLGAVYSRYSDAETRQTSEPACLVRRLFPVEKAREVFGLYQEFEGSLSVFSDGRVIRDRLAQERMGHHLRRLLSLSTEAKQPNDGRFHIVRDTAEWMSRHAHEIEKFCMFFENAEAAEAALPRFYALEGVEVVQGSPDNIEVTAKGVDKGSALQKLAEHLGLAPEQVIAVGDSRNDLSMIRYAGTGLAVANACDELKQAANAVACTSDAGVLRYIYHHFVE